MTRGDATEAMRPDINVRLVRTMHRYLVHQVSPEEGRRFLAAIGLDEDYLKNENNWVDYALYNRAWETIRAQTGDPAIGLKVGRFNISRQNLGSLWAVLRAAGYLGGGTAAAYRFVPRIANQLGRSGEFAIDSLDRTGARMRWTQHAGYPFARVQCEYRQGLLSAGPQMAGLPPARIDEVACIGHGDPACVYAIRFVGNRAVAGVRIGAGLAAACVVAAVAGQLAGPLAGALAVAAVALGWARDSTSQLSFTTAILSHQLEELVEATMRLQDDYDRLRDAQERLRESERLASLGQLSARVAHELRNPLGVIKGAAQVLGDEAKSVEVKREMTGFILEEADRMSASITNFLVFARPKASDRTPVDVGLIVERLLLEWSARSETTVPVRWRPSPALPPVLADGGQLHQVLLNLLLNATEAMNGSGAIEITAAPVDGRLCISVSDEGPGFDAAARARAFEPFFTTKEFGTGLGLTNVRQMIEANDGEVTLGCGDAGGGRVSLWLELAS
jgi:signal transduction histidine kinase